MIDSHCHLNFIKKNGTPEQLVSEAKASGVHTIINIGTDLHTSEISAELAKKFDNVYALVGVHPHDAQTVNQEVIEKIKKLTEDEKVIGIGEIGLDFYRNLSPQKVQKKTFQNQLELAVELKMPIVIHTREAFDETIEIVKDYAADLNGGVFHCFPGTIDNAFTVFEMGFIISVGGVITYKNSRMAEVARDAPLDKIILETDAPFLTPAPYRGKTNRPELVKLVYEKLAELKKMELTEIEKVIDRTCSKLFSLVEVFGD